MGQELELAEVPGEGIIGNQESYEGRKRKWLSVRVFSRNLKMGCQETK